MVIAIAMLLVATAAMISLQFNYPSTQLEPPLLNKISKPMKPFKTGTNTIVSTNTQNKTDDSCTCIDEPIIKKKDPFPYCQQCPSDLIAIKETKPNYPPAAVAMGLQGAVDLKVFLNHDGHVLCVFVEKSPNDIFSSQAALQVSQWEYSANKSQKGPALWCFRKVTINYELNK